MVAHCQSHAQIPDLATRDFLALVLQAYETVTATTDGGITSQVPHIQAHVEGEQQDPVSLMQISRALFLTVN